MFESIAIHRYLGNQLVCVIPMLYSMPLKAVNNTTYEWVLLIDIIRSFSYIRHPLSVTMRVFNYNL